MELRSSTPTLVAAQAMIIVRLSTDSSKSFPISRQNPLRYSIRRQLISIYRNLIYVQIISRLRIRVKSILYIRFAALRTAANFHCGIALRAPAVMSSLPLSCRAKSRHLQTRFTYRYQLKDEKNIFSFGGGVVYNAAS